MPDATYQPICNPRSGGSQANGTSAWSADQKREIVTIIGKPRRPLRRQRWRRSSRVRSPPAVPRRSPERPEPAPEIATVGPSVSIAETRSACGSDAPKVRPARARQRRIPPRRHARASLACARQSRASCRTRRRRWRHSPRCRRSNRCASSPRPRRQRWRAGTRSCCVRSVANGRCTSWSMARRSRRRRPCAGPNGCRPVPAFFTSAFWARPAIRRTCPSRSWSRKPGMNSAGFIRPVARCSWRAPLAGCCTRRPRSSHNAGPRRSANPKKPTSPAARRPSAVPGNRHSQA